MRMLYFVTGWLCVVRAVSEMFWRSDDNRRMQMMLDAQDGLVHYHRPTTERG